MSYEAFHATEFVAVSQDIIWTKFLTEEFVEIIKNACTSANSWKGNRRQPYFTQDIHFEKELPEWYDILAYKLNEDIFPKACRYWEVENITVQNIFAVRYSLGTQRELKQHHDDSFISGSIKLNDSYTGGELYFPRQKFTNKNIGTGDLLLWPGQITHIHGSTALLTGEKYSVTIWTKNEDLENHR